MTTATVLPTLRCIYCKSPNIVEFYKEGYTSCISCNAVNESLIIDTGNEKRHFEGETEKEQNDDRCEKEYYAQADELIGQSSYTKIAKDRTGSKLSKRLFYLQSKLMKEECKVQQSAYRFVKKLLTLQKQHEPKWSLNDRWMVFILSVFKEMVKSKTIRRHYHMHIVAIWLATLIELRYIQPGIELSFHISCMSMDDEWTELVSSPLDEAFIREAIDVITGQSFWRNMFFQALGQREWQFLLGVLEWNVEKHEDGVRNMFDRLQSILPETKLKRKQAIITYLYFTKNINDDSFKKRFSTSTHELPDLDVSEPVVYSKTMLARICDVFHCDIEQINHILQRLKHKLKSLL